MAYAEAFTGDNSFYAGIESEVSRYLPFRCENEWYSVQERQLVHIAKHCFRVGKLVETLFPEDEELILAAHYHDWGKVFVPKNIYFAGELDKSVVAYHFKNHDLDTLRLMGPEYIKKHALASYYKGTHHNLILRPIVRKWLQEVLGHNLLNEIESNPQSLVGSSEILISDFYMAGLEERPDRKEPKEKGVLIAQIKEELWRQFPQGLPLEIESFDHDRAYEAAREITQATHQEGNDLFYWHKRLPYSLTSSPFYLGHKSLPRVDVGVVLQRAISENSLWM